MKAGPVRLNNVANQCYSRNSFVIIKCKISYVNQSNVAAMQMVKSITRILFIMNRIRFRREKLEMNSTYQMKNLFSHFSQTIHIPLFYRRRQLIVRMSRILDGAASLNLAECLHQLQIEEYHTNKKFDTRISFAAFVLSFNGTS